MWHELLQRLNGVEETCRIGSCNIDACSIHCEFVCLVCQSSVLGHNQTGGSRCRINGHLDAACLFELCGKLLCIACHGFIASRGGDSSELLEVECALVARKVGGVGYEGKHVFSFAEQILSLYKGKRLVCACLVVPQAKRFTSAGTAPLVHVHERVGLRRKHPTIGIACVGCGLPHKVGVLVRCVTCLELTFLCSCGGIELHAVLTGQRVTCSGIAFNFPQLVLVAFETGSFNFGTIAFSFEYIVLVQEFEHVPMHLIARAHLWLDGCCIEVQHGHHQREQCQ